MRKASKSTVSPLVAGDPGTMVWELVSGPSTGADLGVMALEELEPGAEQRLHRHPSEQASFVLEGSGSLLGPGGATPVETGTAFYLPAGSWHGFRNDSSAKVVLVTVYSGIVALAELEAEVSSGDPGEGSSIWFSTLAATAPDSRLDEGAGFWGMGVHWLVTDAGGGARDLVLGASTFHPDGSHDLHRHPRGEEYLYIVEGGGVHVMEGAEVRLEPGEVACIPANEWHGFETDEGVTTRAVFGYFGVPSLDAAGYEVLKDGRVEQTIPPTS